jgi:hypothetical protein
MKRNVQASLRITQHAINNSRFTELQLIGLTVAYLLELLRAYKGVYGQRFYIDRLNCPGVPAVIIGWVGFKDEKEKDQ